MLTTPASVAERLNPLGHDGYYLKGCRVVTGESPYSFDVRFCPRLRGGKGGFSALLKQEGERIAERTSARPREPVAQFQARALASQPSVSQRRRERIERLRRRLAAPAVPPPAIDLPTFAPQVPRSIRTRSSSRSKAKPSSKSARSSKLQSSS